MSDDVRRITALAGAKDFNYREVGADEERRQASRRWTLLSETTRYLSQLQSAQNRRSGLRPASHATALLDSSDRSK